MNACVQRIFIFKKVGRGRKEAKVSQIRFPDKYIAIQELHEKENLSITLLCKIACISRAAYYKWLRRAQSHVNFKMKRL